MFCFSREGEDDDGSARLEGFLLPLTCLTERDGCRAQFHSLIYIGDAERILNIGTNYDISSVLRDAETKANVHSDFNTGQFWTGQTTPYKERKEIR